MLQWVRGWHRLQMDEHDELLPNSQRPTVKTTSDPSSCSQNIQTVAPRYLEFTGLVISGQFVLISLKTSLFFFKIIGTISCFFPPENQISSSFSVLSAGRRHSMRTMLLFCDLKRRPSIIITWQENSFIISQVKGKTRKHFPHKLWSRSTNISEIVGAVVDTVGGCKQLHPDCWWLLHSGVFPVSEAERSCDVGGWWISDVGCYLKHWVGFERKCFILVDVWRSDLSHRRQWQLIICVLFTHTALLKVNSTSPDDCLIFMSNKTQLEVELGREAFFTLFLNISFISVQ